MQTEFLSNKMIDFLVECIRRAPYMVCSTCPIGENECDLKGEISCPAVWRVYLVKQKEAMNGNKSKGV